MIIILPIFYQFQWNAVHLVAHQIKFSIKFLLGSVWYGHAFSYKLQELTLANRWRASLRRRSPFIFGRQLHLIVMDLNTNLQGTWRSINLSKFVNMRSIWTRLNFFKRIETSKKSSARHVSTAKWRNRKKIFDGNWRRGHTKCFE